MAKSQAELDLAREGLEVKREGIKAKSGDVVLSGVMESLAGGDSVYARQVEANTKQKTTQIKALSSYYTALNGGSAARRVTALANLAETMFTTPERLAKLTSAANPAVLQTIAQATGYNFGDDASESKTKAPQAWQMFYQQANSINGLALKATYDRMVEQYGPPQESYLGDGDGLRRVHRVVQQKVQDQNDLIQRAYQGLQTLTDQVRSGDEDAAMQGYEEIARWIPGVATPKVIQTLQEQVEAAPTTADLTDPALIAERDQALAMLKELRGEEAPAVDKETNFFAEWLSSDRIQEWAKFPCLRVGQVLPLTEENKKRLAEGKIMDGVVTPNGIYVPGPDDARAAKFGAREMKQGPEGSIWRAAGLGRPSGRTQEIVEFDIVGDPKMKQHPDGAWYFEETPEGGRTYLTEDDIAARRAVKPTVVEAGRSKDGGSIWKLSDGRIAFLGKDATADTPAILPASAAAAILDGARMVPAEGKLRLPEGITGLDDPEAMPAGITRTTTPPQGARETIRLVKDMSIQDGSGTVAGFDAAGRRKTYTKDQVVGEVRTLEGGQDRKTAKEAVRSLRTKGVLGKFDDALEETTVPGEKPTAGDKADRRARTEALREGTPGNTRAAKVLDRQADRADDNAERLEALGADDRAAKVRDRAARTRAEGEAFGEGTKGIPLSPYSQMYENFAKRPTSPEVRAEQTQRAKADPEPTTTTNLQGVRALPGGDAGPDDEGAMVRRRAGAEGTTPSSGVSAPPTHRSPTDYTREGDKPLSDSRYNTGAYSQVLTQEKAKKKPVVTTGTSVETPTASR